MARNRRNNKNSSHVNEYEYVETSSRRIKEKFQYQREEERQAKPLVPLTEKQKTFMRLIREKDCIVATGLAGTSKSYIPSAMAADMYRLGQIDKIIVTRPAISSSKSLGYFKGTSEEKLTCWLGPVIDVLKERLGSAAFEIAMNKGDIHFVPLETIKGSSFNNAFVIVEESSDLTKEEIIKLVTRVGKNTKITITGDVLQAELNGGAGMKWLSSFVQRNNLDGHFGFVDFNSYDDIVRSGVVKSFLIALHEEDGINRR